METEETSPAYGKLVVGIVIIVLGVIFTLQNFGWVDARFIKKLIIPGVLIAVGAIKIKQGGQILRSTLGWALVFVGTLILLDNYHVLDFSVRKLFPLILVFFGLRLVLGGLSKDAPTATATSVTTLNDWVAFGGSNRRVTSPEFKGGHLAAFCGGIELDLTGADISADRAVIDIFAMWGGVDIRVPPDWDVTVKVFPFLGGYEDKTVHPVREEGKPVKQLVLTGTVVMGGLDIKN